MARSRADDRGDTGAERASLRGVRRGRAVGVARWFFVRRVVKNVVVAAPRLCGGVVGGVLQSFVVSPFELVKIRQQAAGGAVTLAVSTLAGTLGRAGLATRGLGATLLRDGVPHGVWFVAYEWSKRRMTVRATNDDENDEAATTSRGRTDAAVPLCAGAFAAAVAWGVGYPADLVKTRVQAHAARSRRRRG